jgi:hypothetical protein
MKTLEECEAMIRNDPHTMQQMVALAIATVPCAIGHLLSMASAPDDTELFAHASRLAADINGFVREQAKFNSELSQALDLVRANPAGPAH